VPQYGTTAPCACVIGLYAYLFYNREFVSHVQSHLLSISGAGMRFIHPLLLYLVFVRAFVWEKFFSGSALYRLKINIHMYADRYR